MNDDETPNPVPVKDSSPNSRSATYLTHDEADLCCCEYINAKGERSHILGFCCDCDTLDDSFERLIQRQDIPESHVHEICSVLTDRLRIPWCGGARKINVLAVTPFGLLPGLAYLATIGPFSTVISFLLIPIILRILTKSNGNIRTPFHFSLSISSLVYSFIVVYITNTSDITTWFIYIFNVLLYISIFIAMGVTKWRAGKDPSIIVENLPSYYYCRKCQIYVNGRDHHCNWLDCCVGQRNRSWFILTLFCAIIWILGIIYSYYNSLHGFSTEAIYKDYSSAISFVTTLYGVIILLFLTAILTHQLSMAWKGVSYLDWKFKKNLK